MADASIPQKDTKRLQVHQQTRLCKFFVMGKCTRGQSCAFAHGQDKLRQQPDFSKTRLCADFMELGSCAEGEGCKFAHGKSELRPGSAVKIGRPSKKEMQDSPEKKDKDPAAVQGIQAAKILQLQHSLHSQAALNLLMGGGEHEAAEQAARNRVSRFLLRKAELFQPADHLGGHRHGLRRLQPRHFFGKCLGSVARQDCGCPPAAPRTQ
ncbi:unnamed protein product [Durusdinium trenchii]|uniref:C3H1-type domain-containing protein n=1 Tax=Durusdinium trenchii TaxID=1381693 RepID=A0ABP0LD44_9DINO